MRLFKKLRRKLDYLAEEHIQLVEQAYFTALDAHRGQKRRTGEPYITHPVAVACILADMKMDHETIMAALMHDVIEDTEIEKEELAELYGTSIAELIDGVSKLTQIEFHSRAEQQAENFRKMVLAMAKDIRVIIVKLADRLHNMRTLGSLNASKRRRIALETLEIFAPIAKRLGMRELSVELEELGFKIHHPRRYDILKEAVRRVRGNRKKMLSVIEKALTEGISKATDIPPCVVSGREKHLYSIYRKMRSKHIPFNEIMDVYAFRIVTDKVDTCYRVLGIVHSLFKPVPERFKDYIAIPKANGYQSLHTTLFGPYGLPIEVQIRTTEMARMATSGIAAHWLYKSGDEGRVRPHVRAQKWVKNLLELQQRAGSSIEFIENVKVDLFPDEVYVFTPKGEIKELPAGATAIDFAYAVHTDIGNNTVAVKIDRQLAPLSTQLSSGNTLEIITSSRARPNPAWLDFVTTGKARSAIKHFLKSQRKTESVSLGKQLLQKALSRHSLSIRKLPEEAINQLLRETKLDVFEDLLGEIGLGNRVAPLVAQRFIDIIKAGPEVAAAEMAEQSNMPLYIKGTEGTMINFAACCHPIPGDTIVGVMSAGHGLTVHVDKCPMIAKLHRELGQCMPLRWSDEQKGDFVVTVRVQMRNKKGILALAASTIAEVNANIEDISIAERDGEYYWVDLKILVRDRMHLSQVYRGLRQMPGVVRFNRSR